MSKGSLLALCVLAAVLGVLWMSTGHLPLGGDLAIVGILAVLFILSVLWGLDSPTGR